MSDHPRGNSHRTARLLVEAKGARLLVVTCCDAAARAGVRPGMTLANARALLPGWTVRDHPHEPARDAAALRSLASWAVRFSPMVAPDPPDGLLLDVTGCERLYGDERRLVNVIGNSLERLGFAARLACAPTIGCAWAVARCGEEERAVLTPDDVEEALRPLPVTSLRLDPETADDLLPTGVRTIAQLLEVPRLEISVRFAPDLLHRLDQAFGEVGETFEPIRPVEPVAVERCFDGPVLQIETLLSVIRSLVESFCKKLQQRECGAQRLCLHIERLDADPLDIALTLSRASRDAKHLWSLLRPRAESMHLGFGVERITLRAMELRTLRHRQQTTLPGDDRDDDGAEETPAALGELIDTLSHHLGAERTRRAMLIESHVPERVAIEWPALAPKPRVREAAVSHGERPPALFSPPETAEVMALTPDGPPVSLRWRGRSRALITAHGPERIASEWWRRHLARHGAVDRDYFRVQDETGRWLWLFRENRRWFVHGEWA